MNRTVRIDRTGGPEVMVYAAATLAPPGPGEVLVRQHAVGLNFLDVYYRSGQYPHPLPTGLGVEAAGVVEEIGPGVEGLAPGDRVAYAHRVLGAYATARVMPAAALLRLPDALPFETAATMMVRGLTAQYLLRQTYPVKPGDVILLHAAAGGVGLLLSQWARHLGATVIGTVGSDEKAEVALAHGCHHVIIHGRENVVDRVRAITGGEGVPVVYDSVGRDTYRTSLDCLRPLGMFVSFGNASGPLPPIDSRDLASRGSLFFTRPGIFTHIADRTRMEVMAAELFDMVGSGRLAVDIRRRYPLSEVVRAHRELEGRKTTGASILVPD